MIVNKTVNMTATCKITDIGDTIMILSGNVNTNGRYSVNRCVENPELYDANKEKMDADEEEFVSLLLSKINQTGDGK